MTEGRETWLTPIGDAWERVMGVGTFSFKMGAGLLGKLKKGGAEPAEIAARLERYLADTPPRYVSLARFVATYNAWGEAATGPSFEIDDAGVIRE